MLRENHVRPTNAIRTVWPGTKKPAPSEAKEGGACKGIGLVWERVVEVLTFRIYDNFKNH